MIARRLVYIILISIVINTVYGKCHKDELVSNVTIVTVQEEGSYCMTTNGTGTGLSPYLKVCCVNSNLGQTVEMRGSNHKKLIICPSVRLHSCPPSDGKLIGNYYK